MHDETGPWRLGKHRGHYAAVTGSGPSRRRIKLDEADPASAQSAVRRLNIETNKQAALRNNTVLSIYDLYIKDRTQEGIANLTRVKEVRKVIERVWPTLSPADLSKEEIARFTSLRRKDGCGNATIRQELAYLTAALNVAKRERIIQFVPDIRKPPPPRPRERYLERHEVDALLANCPMLYAKLFIVLAISTAARPKHILELTWDRVDFKHRLINFDDPKRHVSRKGRARVPMNDTAITHLSLAKDLAIGETVIEVDGRSIKSIRRAIKESARRAGMPDVSQYVLRHTAGVWMARAGVDLARIAEYMGHASVETTRKHYAKFHPEYLRDASQALDLIRLPVGTSVPTTENEAASKDE
jgi:integrase